MIYIAGDHYGAELAGKIGEYFKSKGIAYENIGSKNIEEKLSLQEMIPSLTKKVLETDENSGILICGTGAGIEIGANRFSGIRASLCVKPQQAEYARIYDNANVLCLSSWITEEPAEILNAWLSNSFDGNEQRKQMLKEFDSWQ